MLLLKKVDQAKRFAEQMHQGQVRKLTGKPYFTHVENVASILLKAGCSEELIAAGYLHDIVEDTSVTIDEIEEMFGSDIARLVASNTEDKSLSWEERKRHTIYCAADASLKEKCLLAADKLDNIKSMYDAFQKSGEEIWGHFKRGKDKQGWYYKGVTEKLFENLEAKSVPTFFFSLKRYADELFTE
ncbi:HD domain-containing protein [Metabacillus sp. RGM 3146]|uniref:HD domain-containing protein n=1 Tax=Metabacillus sp. RGM 3146 TaxID=3401092 RepID=UPI003B9BCA38